MDSTGLITKQTTPQFLLNSSATKADNASLPFTEVPLKPFDKDWGVIINWKYDQPATLP